MSGNISKVEEAFDTELECWTDAFGITLLADIEVARLMMVYIL